MASRNQDTNYGGPFGNFSCTTAEGFRRFASWIRLCRPQGVYLDERLVFAHNPKWGNGIAALSPWCIEERTVVVKMPKSHCLTTRTVSSPELRDLLDHPDFDPVTALTIAYIYECLLDRGSGWYGYLSCMSLPDVPRLWEDEEKAWLKGTEVEDQTFDMDRGALEVFRKIVLPFFQKHTELFPMLIQMQSLRHEKMFMEAISVVISRTFPVDKYHGLGLVPLADMFNHAEQGHEHVEFQTEKDVCPDCGALDERMCECNEYDPEDDCPICGDPPEEECDCLTTNTFMYYGAQETATLDPEGRGWEYKYLELRATRPADSCEMVTTRDVCTKKEHLFNNYGTLNNVEALTKYGFINPECQIDTVCLRREIFYTQTEYYTPDAERTKFWSDQGSAFLHALGNHATRPLGKEWESIEELETIPENGSEFVIWSLTIGKDGHVRCGLKVWLLLVDLLPGIWKEFMSFSIYGKVETMLPYLAIFDYPRELIQIENRMLTGWLNLLHPAVAKRNSRYSMQDSMDYVKRRAKLLPDIDVGTREGKATWIKENEMKILTSCERDVGFSKVLLGLTRQPVDGIHYPNYHFAARDGKYF